MRTKLIVLTTIVTMAGMWADTNAHPGGMDVCGGHVQVIQGVRTYHTHNKAKLANCERIFNEIKNNEKFSFFLGDGKEVKRVFVD